MAHRWPTTEVVNTGLAGIDENAQNNLALLTEAHLALLANSPGMLVSVPSHTVQPNSARGAAFPGTSVSASETPMSNPAGALNQLQVLPDYTWFVGRIKDMHSPLSGHAHMDEAGKGLRGKAQTFSRFATTALISSSAMRSTRSCEQCGARW